MDAYRKYLAENVLSEDKVVTYRLLSRALHVHPNTAKQMLYEFHKSENGKKPGRVHATYLVYGIKTAETSSHSQNGTDGDIEMTSSMPEVESLNEPVPTFTLTLIQEENLEDALAEYEEVSSIHVYSIGPHPAKDLALLADAAQQALALGHNDSQTVVIKNSNVRRRERRGVAANASAPAPVAKTLKQEPKAVQSEPKSEPKSALSKAFAAAKPKAEVKEEPKAEKEEPAASSKPASTADKKKSAPALKRGGSNTSSIMAAFSKAATKVKKAETSQPATPSADESSVHPMSDDGEDDSEMPQPAPRSTAGRKTRKEREEELRRMMEEDDSDVDDDGSEKRAESPEEEAMDETADEPAALEPEEPEPAETVTTSNGRRRGKRKVMRKKQMLDDQGYLVTVQEPGWESFSEDEAPPATKPKIVSTPSSGPPSQAAKSKKGGAKGSQGTQGSIMSFFSKK